MKEESKEFQKTTVKSPCVSNCCLDDHDICLGCFRHIDEITGWHSANSSIRQEILKKTEQRKVLKQKTLQKALAKGSNVSK